MPIKNMANFQLSLRKLVKVEKYHVFHSVENMLHCAVYVESSSKSQCPSVNTYLFQKESGVNYYLDETLNGKCTDFRGVWAVG